MSTQLLIDEYPLIVLPSLAKAVGLEKAIILQQVHYWMKKSTHERDGHLWIYNSYRAWAEQFTWLSEASIKKHILELEKKGLLISGNYNKFVIDRTKWYRIDYEALAKLTPNKTGPNKLGPDKLNPDPDELDDEVNLAKSYSGRANSINPSEDGIKKLPSDGIRKLPSVTIGPHILSPERVPTGASVIHTREDNPQHPRPTKGAGLSLERA